MLSPQKVPQSPVRTHALNFQKISYRELTDLITYVKKLKIDTRTTILTKSDFSQLSHKTNLTQSDKLYAMFGKDDSIDCIEVVVAVSFLVEWRDVEKQYQMKTIFEVIDVNNDGSVEKEEMMSFFFKYFRVKSKLNGYPFTKQRWLALQDHIERNFAASDIDHNGVVDFSEFLKAVENPDHPLAMIWNT